MQGSQPSRRRGRGLVTGGLLLVLVGLLWFLSNLGYLPGDLWHNLWRFWPLLLVVVGLEVALRGFPDRVALPILLLGVVALLAAVLVLAPTLPADQATSHSFRQEIGQIDQARLELEMDDATLNIDSLPDDPDLLATGQFEHDWHIAIHREFTESSGHGTLKLADRYEAFFPFFFLSDERNDWTLRLSRHVPLELDLTGDDCEVDLRLGDLTLSSLVIKAVDCTGQVVLPPSDGLDATLSLSDSELTVVTPTATGVSVEINLDDAQLAIDSSRFVEISTTQYISQGFDQAAAIIGVSIEAADSTVSVR